jgi:acetyltransferase-like isoleucine patch superfamily enzyme
MIMKISLRIRNQLSKSGKRIDGWKWISPYTVIGEMTYGAQNIEILHPGPSQYLKIGSYCSIADGVKVFLGGNHRMDWVSTFPFGHLPDSKDIFTTKVKHASAKGKNVAIGSDVWIGSNVTIMSGLEIGDGAVIAANSHVVSDVEPYAIVGGNPARLIRMRFDEEIIALLIELEWWKYSSESVAKIVPLLSAPPSPKSILKMRDLLRRSS